MPNGLSSALSRVSLTTNATRSSLIRHALLAALMLLVSASTQRFEASMPGGASILLLAPASALGFVALLLAGWRPLPTLALALLAAAIWNQPRHQWLEVMAGQALLLAGLALAATLLRRRALDLSQASDLRRFLLLGVGLAGLPAALTVGLNLGPPAPGSAYWPALGLAWGPHALAVLLLVPPVLAAYQAAPTSGGIHARLPWGTTLLATATLFGGLWLFWGSGRSTPEQSAWLFAPLVLLSWLSLCASPVLAAGLAAVLAASACAAGASGAGPMSITGPVDRAGDLLIWLWAYAGGLALIPLLSRIALSRAGQGSAHWRASLETAGMGLAYWDLRQGRHEVSEMWRHLVNDAAVAHDQPLGWLDACHPLDRSRLLPSLAALLAGQPAEAAQASCCESLRLRDPADGNGAWRWCELRLQVQQRDGRGRALRLTATLADISWQRSAEERQRMAVSLFQHLHEGLLLTDTQHRLLDANPSYCRLMNRPREALAGEIALPLQPQVLHPAGITPADLADALARAGYWQGQVRCLRHDGRPLVLSLTVSTIPEPEGPVRFHVIAVSDLTEQLEQRSQLEHQARYDLLTGLPNPAELRQRLDQALHASQQQGFMVCVACLDLDLFRRINEKLGRALADQLLGSLGRRLQAALRSGEAWSDEVGRLGGDEFGLILRCRDAEEARRAVERMLNVLRAPMHLEGLAEPLELGASLGATLYPQDPSDGETLLRHASHALYRVKRSGRNGYQFFDTEKRLRNEARVLALGRMQQALDSQELQLFYQPKVDMRSGKVLGAEALLRWQDPERGLLTPAQFLPMVENTGLGVQIGDWVLEQALQQNAQWLSAGLKLRVSVNVSARHLQRPDFSQRLQELLARHPVPVAAQLMLEVLESAALADVEATQALIRRCRGFGVRFALDDFGTGYSNLSYLKQLPVDTLKIDRSFVQNMLIDDQDKALVAGVIGLARHFGCSVVAEGIETAAHAQALLAMGCELGQGNGIAAAMPAADLPVWVARFEQAPVLSGRPLAATALQAL